MSYICKELHKVINELPLVEWEFDVKTLPKCGIYFFYEKSELCSHLKNAQRIVRIGTHKKNNFRSRIKSHYVFNENQLNFSSQQSAPHDRSIFRNHIGRCYLKQENNIGYVESVWVKNKNPLKIRAKLKELRDINTEMNIEKKISDTIRKEFSFRYIVLKDENSRIGSGSMESAIIATIAQCNDCKPSDKWLGNSSTDINVRKTGLWNVRCVNDSIITEKQFEILLRCVENTKKFLT